MIIKEGKELKHYGTPRKSGRYPWGSGDNPHQRNKQFLDHVQELKEKGMSEADIAKGFGMTVRELRDEKSIAKNELKQANISTAVRLKEKGLSNVAIGEQMGLNESSVRSLLSASQKEKVDILQTTADMLREQVAEKQFIQIGTGVETDLGISATKLGTAVAVLKNEGYREHKIKIEQLGTGLMTEVKVLTPPGTEWKDVAQNKDKIRLITEKSVDSGRSYLGLHEPLSISSKRVAIRYAEDGGATADGTIYVRPGVKDVSLGKSHYAQVRIAVDGTHYLKGMAVYKDDLPPGVDLMFNTNKSSTGNKLDAMKPMKRTKDGEIDKDNPFGSYISNQLVERDSKGKERTTSAMNIVNEAGDWEGWKKSLSTQMLSKQSPSLAKTQLDLTYEQRKIDFDEIMGLTNPAIKRKLLKSFSDDVDSAAVHLKAAALPRQRAQVILPVNGLKDTEVYAPNFRNGERVALIRFPHGGKFEIPELTVNNKHPEAKSLLGQARDAIGINSEVAKKLSGADFDGDTVLVIPNNSRKVQSEPALAGLRNFDPQTAYPGYPGMRVMTARDKAVEMGKISNLITDMTIQGANNADLARAVRHSMVVIDAEKHGLNYKLSAEVNGIQQLKTKYQGSGRAGASTLISKATSDIRVNERKQGFRIDPVTGKKIYVETGATYTDKNGKLITKTTISKKLAETDDAHTLSSGTPIEKLYADHSNRLKDLANTARLAMVNTKTTPYSPSAKAAYSKEVASLNASLHTAFKNRPLERQAQLLANTIVSAKRQANPDMDPAELKKIKYAALEEARIRTGAKKNLIEISDDEWKAIQAGAITNSKLTDILNNADLTRVKELATPRSNVLMTSVKQRRAEAMFASGYTQAEIADVLGVSLSTLKKSLGGS